MSESKSAFGCDHANVRRVHGDAATICAAISKLCNTDELNLRWDLREMLAGVDLNSRDFPVVQIYLEIQGAKVKEEREGEV